MNQFDDEASWPGYVDVTIVEFAAHTAYLDPLTGTGYLVTPRPENDIAAPEGPFVEVAWSERLTDYGRVGGLSLYTADRLRAVRILEQEGWTYLHDECGQVEEAGRTTDGRRVLCLYGSPMVEEPTLDALSRALIALDIAADIDVQSRNWAN
ncbi:hypothetical protein EV643_14311 [Kribbella sp. VKM Ac-2527]|uniref:Uncharacterized protein n=1 Tax=Kribbella caucasensis TaxID=2512215 RepID=A0A4R6J3D7_9ACTN|nr:hypothetical protein [Kribbella sp. VKM Ac-2527]TDO29844.1 hypothetical protein EV643_14311 [Kribbella sp. VKM Ac-2527]